jgi:hypothetical protein
MTVSIGGHIGHRLSINHICPAGGFSFARRYLTYAAFGLNALSLVLLVEALELLFREALDLSLCHFQLRRLSNRFILNPLLGGRWRAFFRDFIQVNKNGLPEGGPRICIRYAQTFTVLHRKAECTR